MSPSGPAAGAVPVLRPRSTRFLPWESLAITQIAVMGLWLAQPEGPWGIAAAIIGFATVALAAFATDPRRIALSVVGLAGAGAAVHTSVQVSAVETRWPEVREGLIRHASQQLDETLAEAVALVEALAQRGVSLPSETRDEAFRILEGGLAGRSPERGVVVFGDAGAPWAWAGQMRLATDPGASGLRARITPFYVVLEAQREANGRVAVGQILLAADSAIPNRDESVAARFARATGSELLFFAPASAPVGADVFDFCIAEVASQDTVGTVLPVCQSPGVVPDTLFSVLAVPPTQGTRKLNLLERGGRRVALSVLIALVVFVVAASRPYRVVAVLLGGILLVATPFGTRLGLGALFAPGTFFLSAFGVLPASAGAIVTLTALAVMGLAVIWPRDGRIGPAWLLGPAAVVIATPPLMRLLATGITPSAADVPLSAWLVWTIVISLASTALLLASAYVVKRAGFSTPTPWPFWVACGWVVLFALVGGPIWRPGSGWPAWFVWLAAPGFGFAILSARRWRLLVGVSALSGITAALMTWGAVVEGRLILAELDVFRFSQAGDPLPLGFLPEFGDDLLAEGPPRTGAELYLLWRRSPLSGQDYPAVLVVWNPDGEEEARLDLAEIDISTVTLDALARRALSRDETRLEVFTQVPGAHYVLSVPYPDGSVVSVAVGPRSRAVPPIRVARFLRGESTTDGPYRMDLSDIQPPGPTERLEWSRDGSTVRGERAFEVPGGYRHLHVTVSLGGSAVGLVIRGALLALASAAVVLALWIFGEAMAGHLHLEPWIQLVRSRSYVGRLTVVLGVFFLVPTAGFAAWGVVRLGAEANRARDLVIRQTLQDAAVIAFGSAVIGGQQAREQLNDLAGRLDADLIMYEGGELEHSSATILAEMGLVEPYMAPDLFRALVLRDGLEATADRDIGGRLTRVGYRSLSSVDGRSLVLASPRLVEDPPFTDVFALLLTLVIGFGAAVWLAARTAGSLAGPVQALRDAATAVGGGQPIPSFDPGTMTEFVPVIEAFERMADDVKSHQEALEEALKFTGAVLSNIATGVVTVDEQMRVTTANPRALAVLGVDPVSDDPVATVTPDVWAPVWQWVEAFIRRRGDIDTQEFNVGERRIRVQVAVLTTVERGCVVVLDDTTELAMAERVIAWGEMARQVAHEIKNPLTPIRLGVQHLQRAHRDKRGNFDVTLARTSEQILNEIERLNAIARAFSRFGAPPAETGPLTWVDLVQAAEETASLYSVGPTTVTVTGETGASGHLRKDELKEVLVNLVENAREAGAHDVTIAITPVGNGRGRIEVSDDGRGITAEHLARVFEPHFSTNTSGTGLGLAICKRLVESWGGAISAESIVSEGTSVHFEINYVSPGQAGEQ